jgi:hypothetical protein
MPLLSFIHGHIVGMHRKPAKVPYPNAYASAEEARSNVSDLARKEKKQQQKPAAKAASLDNSI